MPKHANMTGWYDPPHLVTIALRVAISTVFGEFADRREAMAAARSIDPAGLDPSYDYSGEAGDGDFWLDFVADTGDGWNSTYAVARLLADPALRVEGLNEALPPGRLLVMGGDEVYPTASRDDYSDKLVAPYDEAAKHARLEDVGRHHLYAVPGNHDWYDGLSGFLGLFCARRLETAFGHARSGRVIGGRETNQTRSYFALQLPRGWWLWGVDVQLAGYVDQPQIDFFEHVADKWMAPASRLILCTGTPDWSYVNPVDPTTGSFRNLDYMASIARRANRQHRLCLVLTGDSHHYSRYTEGGVDYITAGGGGAFLHPTHQLQNKSFTWDYPPPNQSPVPGQRSYRRDFEIARDRQGQPAVFPSPAKSRRLTWRNLAFAYLNPMFAMTMAVICGVFAWLLHASAEIKDSTLSAALGGADGFWAAVAAYMELLVVTPWPPLLALAATGGYIYFSDFPPWGKRILSGGVHALAQMAVVVVATVLLARHAPGAGCSALLILYAAVIGGILSSTVMGAYLLICLNRFGRHWNEAFSSLRVQDFKNFLRLKIAPDGALTVYPVGLTDVPRDDADPPRNPPLHPHLIEAPIRVS